jgi:hypothetical protein
MVGGQRIYYKGRTIDAETIAGKAASRGRKYALQFPLWERFVGYQDAREKGEKPEDCCPHA